MGSTIVIFNQICIVYFIVLLNIDQAKWQLCLMTIMTFRDDINLYGKLLGFYRIYIDEIEVLPYQ